MDKHLLCTSSHHYVLPDPFQCTSINNFTFSAQWLAADSHNHTTETLEQGSVTNLAHSQNCAICSHLHVLAVSQLHSVHSATCYELWKPVAPYAQVTDRNCSYKVQIVELCEADVELRECFRLGERNVVSEPREWHYNLRI